MYQLTERIKRFIGELELLLKETTTLVENVEFRKGKLDFPCDVTAIKDDFFPYRCGEVWSGENYDDYVLFRFTVDLPEIDDNYDYILNISTNKSGGHNMVRPQMLLFAENTALQGLDANHEDVKVTEYAGKGKFCMYVYAFSGLAKKTPYGSWVDLDVSDGVRLYINLTTRNKELFDFYWNVKAPYTYLQYLPENSWQYQKILNGVNDAFSLVDFRKPFSEEFYCSIQKANLYITELLYNQSSSGFGEATLVGHTHIDLAWLWRYSHTMDKVLRSFATEVKLLEEYDNHRFMSSQAQLYEFVKRSCPDLYAKIKKLVAEGRWEAEGSMWVEPDMNLASGESIILQILYGKRFFKEEFGVDNKILWLPDVFGYTAALPQILQKSGISYFMTSKLASNEKNRFPYDTFIWKGIDGSGILAHCTSYLPGTYNPNIENGEIFVGCQNYMQKDINDDVLVPFGYADGGGGVTHEQIEMVKRLELGIPGVPCAKIGTAGDYFSKLAKKTEGNKRLPVWSGEIYYEKHRGTYTSMARIKKQNRKCEFLFSNAQWLWMLANCAEPMEFPKEEFDVGIKNMLLNQFHDVLPGSSVFEVYEDADELYRQAYDIGERMCKKALETLSVKECPDTITVFNPYSQTVSGYAEYNGEYHYVENVPAKGYGTYCIDGGKPTVPVKVSGNVIENEFYIITLSDTGEIASLYDKRANRECFIKGKGANRLRIFDDRSAGQPIDNEDNWNLECYYTEREFDMPAPYRIFAAEEKDEYAVIRMERRYMKSHITQDMIVYARSPRIDFKTEIDWKEHSQVLKAEFPIDVNAQRATYEIQFGHLERPTVYNTPWEDVKFEVCAHKWADISDGGYGMALLNDCKYGYSAKESTLSLTLLRCGNSPNPMADKERHQFVYAILPHIGDIREADVVKEGYVLNNPLFALSGRPGNGKLPERFSLFECSGAVMDTIKPSEDGEGWVLRLYEPYNRSQAVCIKSGRKMKKVIPVDILEHPINDFAVTYTDDEITFRIKPFEIVTLRVM